MPLGPEMLVTFRSRRDPPTPVLGGEAAEAKTLDGRFSSWHHPGLAVKSYSMTSVGQGGLRVRPAVSSAALACFIVP